MPRTKTIDEMSDDELDNLLYSNPRGLINQVRAEERAAGAVERGQSEFWSRFYGRFPNLKPDRGIVEVVLQQNFERLKNTPADDAMETVAELAQQEIEATQRRWARQREYGVMRGGPGIPADQVNVAPEGEASLSSIIKTRKNQRREAASGFMRTADA